MKYRFKSVGVDHVKVYDEDHIVCAEYFRLRIAEAEKWRASVGGNVIGSNFDSEKLAFEAVVEALR